MIHLQGQRLLDKYIFPHLQGASRKAVMLHRRRSDHDSFNIFALEKFFVGIATVNTVVFALQLLQTRTVNVTNDPQPSELVKVTNQILAPISTTHNANCDLPVHDVQFLPVVFDCELQKSAIASTTRS